jgi:hypothetical protein
MVIDPVYIERPHYLAPDGLVAGSVRRDSRGMAGTAAVGKLLYGRESSSRSSRARTAW